MTHLSSTTQEADRCKYPGCPQEVVKDLGWCRSHYPGNPTDLNPDNAVVTQQPERSE